MNGPVRGRPVKARELYCLAGKSYVAFTQHYGADSCVPQPVSRQPARGGNRPV